MNLTYLSRRSIIVSLNILNRSFKQTFRNCLIFGSHPVFRIWLIFCDLVCIQSFLSLIVRARCQNLVLHYELREDLIKWKESVSDQQCQSFERLTKDLNHIHRCIFYCFYEEFWFRKNSLCFSFLLYLKIALAGNNGKNVNWENRSLKERLFEFRQLLILESWNLMSFRRSWRGQPSLFVFPKVTPYWRVADRK